jgi:putative FmdB family regulatory protein
MPTYEFRCPKGHEFEKFYRSMSAAPGEVACPTCGQIAARLLSAGGGLVFKGSGFYITDYGKDGKKPQAPRAGESAGAAEAGAAKTDSSTEAKPSTEAKSGSETKPTDPKTPAAKSSTSKSAGKPKSGE